MIKKCKDLSLKNFIEISEDISNVFLLIEKGDADIKDEDLQDAWLGILDEYNILVKSKNYGLSLRKRAEIEALKQNIVLHYVLIEIMNLNSYETDIRVHSICEKLKLQPNIESIQRKIKGLELTLKLKVDKLPKGISTSFEELKECVERFRNFYIDAEKVNVAEWASYLVAMQKQTESNKQNKNGR